MAPGRQASLTQAGWEGRARRTRWAGLLDQTDPVVPWADLLAHSFGWILVACGIWSIILGLITNGFLGDFTRKNFRFPFTYYCRSC